MSYIETHGNTKLLAITENEYPQLWAEITSDGQAWDEYGDTMGNGNATVIAAEYKGNLYPLFSGCPMVNCDWALPFFKLHGGQAKIALEAEVENNYIFLLQEFPYGSANPTQVVEKFKPKNTNLKGINNSSTNGTKSLSWESSSPLLEQYGLGDEWKKFKSDYSFFKKFGGESTITTDNEEQTTNEEENYDIITAPSKFNKKSADKITNFNPSTDTLEIDANSFGIDGSATFATGKNKRFVKKKLAKQDFEFLYDEKKGGLYFNENGSDKGFGDGGIIAILKGAPDLTSDNLEFI